MLVVFREQHDAYVAVAWEIAPSCGGDLLQRRRVESLIEAVDLATTAMRLGLYQRS